MDSTITIKDFLTDDEIKLAKRLKKARSIADKIITPNINRINKALGQQNDPMYLGYLVEYVVMKYWEAQHEARRRY